MEAVNKTKQEEPPMKITYVTARLAAWLTENDKFSMERPCWQTRQSVVEMALAGVAEVESRLGREL